MVDAADAGALSFNAQIGLHKTAKFAVFPGFHSTSIGDFSIHMDKWNKLSPDLKRILEVAVQNSVARYNRILMIADLETAKKSRSLGITITTLAPEERAKYRAAARKAWEEWAQRSPLARKAIDAHVKYLQRVGALD